MAVIVIIDKQNAVPTNIAKSSQKQEELGMRNYGTGGKKETVALTLHFFFVGRGDNRIKG